MPFVRPSRIRAAGHLRWPALWGSAIEWPCLAGYDTAGPSAIQDRRGSFIWRSLKVTRCRSKRSGFAPPDRSCATGEPNLRSPLSGAGIHLGVTSCLRPLFRLGRSPPIRWPRRIERPHSNLQTSCR